MTEEELINDGWKKEITFDRTIEYKKTINDFHYTLTKQKEYECNWYWWDLHIDTPDFCAVANIEVSELEHIYKIAEIYI